MTTAATAQPSTANPAKSKRVWILLFACALLLMQVIPLLSVRWVADENWYTAPADSLARTGELRLHAFPSDSGQGRVETLSPALMLMLAGFLKVLGTSLYTAKLPHLLAAVAGILLTYLLACELESPIVGLLAAVFLATDNMYFVAARTARPEAMTIAFSLAGILLYLYSSQRRSVLLAVCSGLMVGLAFQIHPNGFAAAITIGLFALREYRGSIVFRARPWAFALAMVVSLVPFLLWATQDAAHRDDLVSMYTAGEMRTLSEIPAVELSRYRDFVGMPSQRFHMGIRLPYRLHVVLALLAAAVLLFRFNRPLCLKLACFIVPCILWWAYIRSTSVRYTAVASPYLAILLASTVVALWNRKPAWRKLVAAVAVLLLVAQVGSNYALLYLYRRANYVQLSDQLHRLIPRDATVYGALIFWMTFHDQQFYSFNRTPLEYALDHGANYLILNDLIMVNGNGLGEDDWRQVREHVTAYVKDHATLVGTAPNAYYGDLEVYRVNQPKVP